MLDHHLGDLGVVLGGHIEGRGHDVALDGALHVGDLLGALVDEQADEVHLGVVRGDRLADALQDRGLACLGRRDDQSALALADRCHEVDRTTRDGVLAMLHGQALVREDGREVAEARTAVHGLGIAAVDRGDGGERRILVPGPGGSDRADDAVTRTQRILFDDGLVDERVIVALHVVAGADHAVALVRDLEQAADGLESLSACGGLEDRIDELALLHAGVLDAELPGLDAQLPHLELGKLLAGDGRLGCSAAAVAAVLLLIVLVAGHVGGLAVLRMAAATRAGALLLGSGVLRGRLRERGRGTGRGLGGGGGGLLSHTRHLLDGDERTLGSRRIDFHCGGHGGLLGLLGAAATLLGSVGRRLGRIGSLGVLGDGRRYIGIRCGLCSGILDGLVGIRLLRTTTRPTHLGLGLL